MISHILSKAKDGGPDSPVDAYFLIEVKGLFSVALLKFNKGKREAYHTHAFNAWTWFLTGHMCEEKIDRDFDAANGGLTWYRGSLKPKFTSKDNNHRVVALEDSWCFTIRGPWCDTWTEHNSITRVKTTFTHGRRIKDTSKY